MSRTTIESARRKLIADLQDAIDDHETKARNLVQNQNYESLHHGHMMASIAYSNARDWVRRTFDELQKKGA